MNWFQFGLIEYCPFENFSNDFELNIGWFLHFGFDEITFCIARSKSNYAGIYT